MLQCYFRIVFVSFAACTVITASPVFGDPTCNFSPWMKFREIEIDRGPSAAYLYVTSDARVDADGAPRAYHSADVGKPCLTHGEGLDCPKNAGYPDSKDWPDILAPDPRDPTRAFIQPDGPFKGYLVSMTALTNPHVARESNAARYVDASVVPYIVFPRPFLSMAGTGNVGDFGVAYHVETGAWSPFIVADVGGDDPLGESSIALFKALGGSDPNPRNGSGIAKGSVLYLIFPYSAKTRHVSWPITTVGLKAAVKPLFEAVGNLPALIACEKR